MANVEAAAPQAQVAPEAPYPGSHTMPRWEVGELPPAPIFTWRSWPLLLGPGLVMGASAIGGGEWLTGPLVTARYGGALLWLATLSILAQVLYNIEISRYALYSGEPIFTGKFRTLPGPMFWLVIYLLLDFGSVLPYLASSAAVPLATVLLGDLPNMKAGVVTLNVLGFEGPLKHSTLVIILACIIFLLAFTPLIFGGKIYNSLKALMSFKLVFVMGFLLFLALLFSTPAAWWEIITGFVSIGNVPVKVAAGASADTNVANVFTTWFSGGRLPPLDYSMIGILASMAAISGNGGLTNTPISNYTRDQGWGMGKHVGAIPSIIARHTFRLSHVGMVFLVNAASLKRWFGWMRHVQRDQLCVWMPACFIGLALPSMLSLLFIPRGTVLPDKWLAASMTAGGVSGAISERFTPGVGDTFWYLTLLCGFLILGTSMVMTADGCLRRWVDVFWTSSPRARKLDTGQIGPFYFIALCVLVVLGLTMLILLPGGALLELAAGMMYNYALGFSCFHVLAVNTLLLPRELRPAWWRRVGLLLAGTFFITIAVLTTIDKLGGFKEKETPAKAAAGSSPAIASVSVRAC
jgi:hypothetical protein